MILQKRWEDPIAFCVGPPRRKEAGMGRWGGRRGSEALGKILKENGLSYSFLPFQFQLKSRLYWGASPYAPYAPLAPWLTFGCVDVSWGANLPSLLLPSPPFCC